MRNPHAPVAGASLRPLTAAVATCARRAIAGEPDILAAPVDGAPGWLLRWLREALGALDLVTEIGRILSPEICSSVVPRSRA
jgi:hypothetical protein